MAESGGYAPSAGPEWPEERSSGSSSTPRDLALFTDLYELAMMRAYRAAGMDRRAVFSLFVRRLPKDRNFLLACGLGTVLKQLEGLRFGAASLHHLAGLPGFPPDFLTWLADYRFSGDVYALPEGTPFFPEEPILEIVAPIAEAQLVETLVMNQVGLQTVLASKAARVVAAAAGRPVVDFGSRRAQGIDAALQGARAFRIAGVAATSNVLAGRMHGIPVTGTVAHSFIEACPSEAEAFSRFAAVYPETVLLVDTYDTIEGVRKVIALARELGSAFRVRGIRLDSGDMAALAKEGRSLLDAAGLQNVQIFASGGLGEQEIARLLAAGAPIDAFGVGTEMSVSADAPALDIAYKLVAYGERGCLKLSPGKRILPGRKQVWRRYRDGEAIEDTIARAGEERQAGTALLQLVMRGGRPLIVSPAGHLADVRRYAAAQIAGLPQRLRGLEPGEPPYPVGLSGGLTTYERRVRQRVRAAERVEAAGGWPRFPAAHEAEEGSQ